MSLNKKSETQNQKNFDFIADLRLAKSFEGLNSYRAQSSPEIFSCKTHANFWF